MTQNYAAAPALGGWLSGSMHNPGCVQCANGDHHTEAEARAAVKAIDSKEFAAYYCPEGQTWHLMLFRGPGHVGLP